MHHVAKWGFIFSLTRIDPWFLNNIKDIVKLEEKIKKKTEDRSQCQSVF